MIKVPYPTTIDDLVSALINLMSDAAQMSDIATQTGEDMRAQQEAVQLVAQSAGAWRADMRGFVARRFDEQVDVAAAALLRPNGAGSPPVNWRSAERTAHHAVVTADRAARRFVDWAQAAEPAYGEAADEAGGIAATFKRVSEAAARWAEAVRAAKHAGSVEVAMDCVTDVKAGLDRQVRPVTDLYQTIHERGAALYDAVGVTPLRHHIYDARLTVAEHVGSCVSICDGLERALRGAVDSGGAA